MAFFRSCKVSFISEVDFGPLRFGVLICAHVVQKSPSFMAVSEIMLMEMSSSAGEYSKMAMSSAYASMGVHVARMQGDKTRNGALTKAAPSLDTFNTDVVHSLLLSGEVQPNLKTRGKKKKKN